MLTGGESLTMPGTKEPELVIDPMGLLKSLVSPRGDHGEDDNAGRSMWVWGEGVRGKLTHAG